MNSENLPLELDVRQKMTLNRELRNPFVAKFRNETAALRSRATMLQLLMREDFVASKEEINTN